MNFVVVRNVRCFSKNLRFYLLRLSSLRSVIKGSKNGSITCLSSLGLDIFIHSCFDSFYDVIGIPEQV